MSFGVLDGDGQVAQIEGHPFGRISFTGSRFAQADVRLLSPILPSKVVCVGKNYAAHVAEMGTGDAPKEPLLFLKPSTSVIGPGDAIRLPPGSRQVHHEAELAVVIGARGARHVTAERPRPSDLRLHVRQRRHRARPAEERRPVDPRQGVRLVLPARAVDRDRPRALGLDPADLEVTCTVDGELRQHGPHQPADLRRPDADLLHLAGDDAAARRRRPDRHPGRRRADRARPARSTSRSRASGR